MNRTNPRKLSVFICSLLIVLFISSVAVAKDIGTVILKNGEKYENVVYAVDRVYKVIKFEYEDKKKNVSFIDIEAILNPDGEDITAKILKRYYKPSRETWLSEESKIIKRARAKKWNTMFRLGGNYSIPSGDYYDGIEPGIGFGGNVHFAINHQIAIQILVSRSGMRVEDSFGIYFYDPNISILSQEYGITTIRYLFALEYYQYLDKTKTENSLWYFYSGLGAAAHTITMKATFQNDLTGERIYIDESDNQSKFIISMGFGIVKMVSKELAVSFDANMDLVHAGTVESRTYGNDVVYAFIFDLKIGLALFL